VKYKIFIDLIIFEIIIILILHSYSQISIKKRNEEVSSKKKLVRELMLTDLSIWTEARYTRHPSQADLFTPFQDFPSSIEHFPAGSIIAPPEDLKGWKSIKKF